MGSTLRGVDLKVTTVTHRPFITPNNLSSGDRYQGLLVDMLRELSNMLGFTFTIHDKVLANRGGYVYIMEPVSVDYGVARNCRLTEVGKRFMPRSYALALAQGSPHREELSRGILRLQESGKMEMLAKKWIGLEGSGCAAQQEGILNWLSGIF